MTHTLDELQHIEGFLIGEDEGLLALSDPPHYACPGRKVPSAQGSAG
jgi:hypothetical protein